MTGNSAALASLPAISNNGNAPSHYGVGFGDSDNMADSRLAAIFMSVYYTIGASIFMAGHGGDTFGYAGSILPVRQPRHVPATPVWRRGAGLTLNMETCTMSKFALRALRPFSHLSFVRRCAIRAYLHGHVSALVLVRLIGGGIMTAALRIAVTAPVTRSTPFAPCNASRMPLLAIQPDIPALDALEAVSNYLDIAFESATSGAFLSDKAAPIWAALHMIETSRAIVDALIAGMERASISEEANHADL